MIKIDAYYDILCPFCFLAKRSLELAREERPVVEISLSWKPFMLHPEFSRGPHSFRGAFVEKYGEGARVPMWDHVIARGRQVGIEFRFYDIDHGFHSILPHRLVHRAKTVGTEDALIEDLFSAFFEKAVYLGDIETLADIAGQHGLERSATISYLESDADEEHIFSLTERYQQDPGVTGMPFYTVNGKAFRLEESGPDSFIKMLDRQATTA